MKNQMPRNTWNTKKLQAADKNKRDQTLHQDKYNSRPTSS